MQHINLPERKLSYTFQTKFYYIHRADPTSPRPTHTLTRQGSLFRGLIASKAAVAAVAAARDGRRAGAPLGRLTQLSGGRWGLPPG